jgi:hypothetical protein
MADLFDFGRDEWARDMPPAMSRIFAAYKEWDAKNPHFYPLFCRFSVQLAQRGHSHLSSKLIFERVRWESMIQTVGDEYKLNNNFTCIYARRFMAEHPQYQGFFRTRELRALTEGEARAA